MFKASSKSGVGVGACIFDHIVGSINSWNMNTHLINIWNTHC